MAHARSEWSNFAPCLVLVDPYYDHESFLLCTIGTIESNGPNDLWLSRGDDFIQVQVPEGLPPHSVCIVALGCIVRIDCDPSPCIRDRRIHLESAIGICLH
jgi:hypothetical protein